MTTTRVVGLCGRAGSGKDTAGDCFEEVAGALGWCVFRLSFAGPIKALAADLFEVNPETFHDRGAKEMVDRRHKVSPRQMCQWLGQTVCERFGEGFWINKVHSRISNILACKPPQTLILVTDVRFPRESEMLRSFGGEVVFIDANRRLGGDEDGAHVTEKHVFRGDAHVPSMTLTNNGSLEDFRKLMTTYAHGVLKGEATEEVVAPCRATPMQQT